jgi:transposase
MSRPIKLPENFNNYNFKTLSLTEPHPRTRIRLLALHHLQQGSCYSQVAKYMQVNITTVKMWMYRFRDKGLNGIKEQHRNGRKSRAQGLSDKIKIRIADMQDNKPGGRITLEDIRAMLKYDFKLDYANPSSVRYLLTQLDLSWISARSKHPKQDKEAQSLYKKLQTKGNRCVACGQQLK